jgi:hypothetical protein
MFVVDSKDAPDLHSLEAALVWQGMCYGVYQNGTTTGADRRVRAIATGLVSTMVRTFRRNKSHLVAASHTDRDFDDGEEDILDDLFHVNVLGRMVAEVRLAEVRPAEVRLVEQRLTEVRPSELEIRLAEVRLAEVRLAEVSLAEVRLAEVSLAEVRLAEVRSAEVSLAEVRPAEVCPVEVPLGEARSAEIDRFFRVIEHPGVPLLDATLEDGELLLVCHR